MKVKGRVLKEAAASLLAVFLLLSLGLSSVFAQGESGQITVKATDANGAAIAGAAVSVKNTGTGAERKTTTNEEGTATFNSLQPGTYDVTISGTGFSTYTRKAEVTVGGRLTVEAAMTAQAKGETVNVVAGEQGVEVNTQTQQLSDTVSQKQITELPTLTRNPYALVAISGNATDADASGRGTGFSINGQRSASTSILLDGGENVDAFVAGVGQSVPLDAVQEFQVITSNFSAEYGRASGGIVNVATRAGSNSFHGSLYEFNRVSALASNSFDNNANSVPKGVFDRNQFGYSLGGKIIKDKLFFFSSTEWTRIRSTGEVISLVPTPQLIAATNANTRAYFAGFSLATPINGQVFTVSQVQAALGGGSGFGGFGTLPGNLPAFGQVKVANATDLGGGSPGNDWQTVNRLDYNMSDKTQIYLRGVYEEGDNPKGSVGFSPWVGFSTGQNVKNQNYLMSITHSFSSNLVSQSKIVFNRLFLAQPLAEQPLVPTMFSGDSFLGSINGFVIRYPGYLADAPGSAIPFGGPQNFLQLYHDMNWTRGNHQLRFGGQYVHIRDNRTFGAYEYADAALGSNMKSSLSNLVAGQFFNFTVAVFPQGKFPCSVSRSTGARIVTPDCTLQTPLTSPNFSRSNRYNEWATYFNDSWKVKPRFTLNLGIRYEYYGTQHNANQNLDSNFYFGDGSTIQDRIRNGSIQLAKSSPIGKLWAVDPNNFAPRLGFAWDIFGNGKTSLRGGYGMAYERNFGNVTFNVIQNPPNYATVALRAGVDVPTIPISLANFGPLSGSGISKSFPPTSLRAVDPHIVNAYAHFWSAALQHQLWGNTIISAEYTASAGRNLYSIANINRPGSGSVFEGDANVLGRLNTSGPSSINFRGSDGRSNYNAMVLSIDSANLRNKGLRLTARYTYSQTRDNLSNTFAEGQNGNFNLGYLDPFNPNLDYGNSEFDVRHRFTSSFVYNIPQVSSAKGFLNQIVNGWELTGIMNIRSGVPFTVYDCSLAFSVCSRAILDGNVNFSGSVDHHSVGVSDTPNRYNYIDLTGLHAGSFVDRIGLAEFGPFPANMSKRDAFRAPGFWNVDSALYKNFKLTERYTLQFRFEAYNVFNHANLFVGYGDADVELPYVPASFNGRRNVQMAMKVLF